MNIPNEAFYASIGTMTTIIGWAARQFVQDSRRESAEKRRAAHSQSISASFFERLNVREYKQIISCIEEVFNGRYLLAEEAREEFRKLETGMDNINLKLANLQAHNSASIQNKSGG